MPVLRALEAVCLGTVHAREHIGRLLAVATLVPEAVAPRPRAAVPTPLRGSYWSPGFALLGLVIQNLRATGFLTPEHKRRLDPLLEVCPESPGASNELSGPYCLRRLVKIYSHGPPPRPWIQTGLGFKLFSVDGLKERVPEVVANLRPLDRQSVRAPLPVVAPGPVPVPAAAATKEDDDETAATGPRGLGDVLNAALATFLVVFLRTCVDGALYYQAWAYDRFTGAGRRGGWPFAPPVEIARVRGVLDCLYDAALPALVNERFYHIVATEAYDTCGATLQRLENLQAILTTSRAVGTLPGRNSFFHACHTPRI